MTDLSMNDADYVALRYLLEMRTGLAFRSDQRQSTETGIFAAMKRANAPNVATYRELLASDPVVLDDLIVELTVGETYFFRHPKQLDYIAEHIVPDICRRRDHDRTIHVWSAGCASGEEPYSLAMLFDELQLLHRVSILGTDISRSALRRCQSGLYRKWSMRDEGGARSAAYLSQEGNEFRVIDRIRNHVRFEYLNLALDQYPSLTTGTADLDLILCRNVLIYFSPETVRSVARQLYDSLADGGWLVLAVGDPMIDHFAPFETIVTEVGVVYRKGTQPKNAIAADLVTSDAFARDLPSDTGGSALSPRGRVQSDVPQLIDQATQALSDGDYDLAIRLTEPLLAMPEADRIRVQAYANVDVIAAEKTCREATLRHQTDAALQYLHGVLLLEMDRTDESISAIRRALFLDRRLVVGHFTLGSVLRRLGNVSAAQRSFRNARNLAAELPEDAVVPLTSNERAGDLVRVIDAQLTVLNDWQALQ